jgi:hypothetical protein
MTRPPARVRPVKRINEDVRAMLLLTESEDAFMDSEMLARMDSGRPLK